VVTCFTNSYIACAVAEYELEYQRRQGADT